MKILAIRGKNLASLGGEFDIDFQQEPLKSTGLFAICGPTGAGKSTLLDALCLALYDATPRLSAAGAQGVKLPDVGEETVSPQDPRNLLRRGAPEGHAEVDFIGNDDRAYRARWSVRRARLRSDGKLQNTELRLTRVSDEQPIGHLKSEVLEEIRTRIGLSFSQFTRAVLLAQNDFATFLKAQDNERAQLLETLTGTDVFTTLSIRAFERAKAESRRLDLIQLQLRENQPLDETQRQALEQRRGEAALAVQSSADRKAELEARIRWYQELEHLNQAVDEAIRSLAESTAQQGNAAARRQRLIQVEAVQNARPLVTELDRSAAAGEQTRAMLAHRQSELAHAEAALTQTIAQRTAAQAALDDAERLRAESLPDLRRAQQLDTEIAALEPAHTQALAASTESRQRLAEAESKLQTKQADMAADRAALNALQRWLDEQRSGENLALQWPRWETLLKQAAETKQELDQATAACQRAERTVAQHTADRAALDSRLQSSAQTQTEAEHELQEAERCLRGLDSERLNQRQAMAYQRLDQLRDAEALWKRHGELRSECARLQYALQQIHGVMEGTRTELAAVQAEKPGRAAALEQAERSLNSALLASGKNVERLRGSLEAGSPCPVCGSTAHPYATDHPQLRAVLDGLKHEVAALRTTVQQLEMQEATQATRLELAEKQYAESTAALEKSQIDEAEAEQQWLGHPLGAQLTAVAADHRAEWFGAQRQALDTEVHTVGLALKQFAAATARHEQARQHFDAARASHFALQKALGGAEASLGQSATMLRHESDRHAAANDRLDRQLCLLDEAFPDAMWRTTWREAPEAFQAQCREQVSAWLGQRQRAETLTSKLDQESIEQAGLEQSVEAAGREAERARNRFEEQDRDLGDRKRQRAALFAGHPANEVESRLDDAVSRTRTRLQSCASAEQQAQQTKAANAAALEHACNDHQAAIHVEESARSALASWLARWARDAAPGPALDETTLRDLLACDATWIAAERDALRNLDDAVNAAQAVLRERQAARGAHQTKQPTEAALSQIEDALRTLQQELDQQQGEFAEVTASLRQDDQRRETAGTLLRQWESQAATQRRWAELSELIGSADGRRFRNLAQQYTLDVLLGYANRHLTDLTHRYRLQRIRDTLALLVVDQDMGDEIRSVHSLSGGESFLVSLALALGLASLSSNRVKVESLFIDEGFGSLDAETLRVAMDALDSLQAKGRKVGVISHVQEMTERIGTRIQVKRLSGGQSRVFVSGH